MKTVLVGTSEPRRAGWPEHLPAGALRVVRWSRHYDETVTSTGTSSGYKFWKPSVIVTAWTGRSSACPADRCTWRSSVWWTRRPRYMDLISLFLPAGCRRPKAHRGPADSCGRPSGAQIDYWEANGGVTYQDPDGRDVVFASWIYVPPRSDPGRC
jgi:hypothetical protein